MANSHRGKKLSTEHKEKIGQSMKGREITWADKISVALKGKTTSPETLKKMQKDNIGRFVGEKSYASKLTNKERDVIIDLFNSGKHTQRAIAKMFNVTPANISYLIKTWRKMKIDLIKLNAEIEAGNVNKQTHPTLPLSIYKYSKQAVYTRSWNEITKICRGLVLDIFGNIIINSIPKFYNNNEPDGILDLEKCRGLSYETTIKMDGSLIQVARWNGNLIVTSSGSFQSAQAIKATEWLNTKYSSFNFQEGLTYIFEIIYSANRIVIDYGDKESLTLLAIRNTKTGEEINLDNFICPFDIVKKVELKIEDIEKMLPRTDFINEEGYITKFENGTRIKWKYDEYMRLHKIISGVNEKFIWEALRDKINLEETLINVPDELYDFIRKVSKELLSKYAEIEIAAKDTFEKIKDLPTRKDLAIEATKNHKPIANILFTMLDKKDYSMLIWDKIKPVTITKLGMGEE